MDNKQSLLLKKYTDLLFRWNYLLIFLLLFSLPLGLGLYLKIPKEYEATSLLSYQQQKINPNKLSPDVSSRIKDIVSTLTQIVTSRTNLESLIKSFDLYGESRLDYPMEDVIDTMRDNIAIEPSPRGDTFMITYIGDNPNKVVKVTNALAAKFIEENLKYREERASETSTYTTNELQMAKTTMDLKEAAMRDYKMQYYNQMPEQQENNVSRLIALQEQYQAQQLNVLELERTKVMVREQIAIRKKVLASQSAIAREVAANSRADRNRNDFAGSNEERLQKMRGSLEVLLVKYTEQHPDVRRSRKLIQRLEQEIAADAGSQKRTGSGKTRLPLDSDLLQLQTQLKDVGMAMATLEKEKDQLYKRIKQYEEWLNQAPSREAEWSALTREYGELKRHYDYLVSQDLQAKSMLNLERRQKGSQFKIEDPARLPETPIRPNFLRIMAASLALGLGFGGALVLAINFLDGSFRDPQELEPLLGVPVVCTVTQIETQKEKKKRRWKSVLLILLIGICSILILGLFWYTWQQGMVVI